MHITLDNFVCTFLFSSFLKKWIDYAGSVKQCYTKTTSGSYLLFFLLLNNPDKRTQAVGRVFEYAGYYENGEYDNHERFPDVRTMSSPRLVQTAIKPAANDISVTRYRPLNIVLLPRWSPAENHSPSAIMCTVLTFSFNTSPQIIFNTK